MESYGRTVSHDDCRFKCNEDEALCCTGADIDRMFTYGSGDCKNGIRIMLSLYLEPYETEPGKTERRVKIVGGEKRSAEERVSSFYAVALYKYLYEKTEDQAAWKQFKEEYLEIPYYVNLYRIQGRTTGGGKQKYTEQYIQQWEAQMRGFLQEEQKKV